MVTNKKPNIIYILSDQHNQNVMGNMGDSIVRTPNLDHLAKKGVMFENCYAASPLCVPSRSSLLSCKLPSKTGIYTNHQSLRSDQATFVNSLGVSDYETVLCGRMHFVGTDQHHGYEKRLVGDFTEAYFCHGEGVDKMGVLAGTTGQNKLSIEKSGPGNSSVIDYDKAVTKGACDFIENRKDKRPLFMTVGYYGPHCPYVCPKELFEEYYEKLDSQENSSLEKQKDVHPAIKKWLKVRGIEDIDSRDIKRVKAAYYGLVTLMDKYIGQIIDKAYKHLDKENTIIVYSSDHGDMIGQKGMFWKSNFFEGSVKVPLIFSYPKEFLEDKRITEPVSLMDLGATFIDISKGPKLPVSDGISLKKVLEGNKQAFDDRSIISEYGARGDEYMAVMIRKGDWKMIKYIENENPLLFNLKNDPLEEKDLGNDDEYLKIRKKLQKEIDKNLDVDKMKETMGENRKHIDIIKKWIMKTRPKEIAQWKGFDGENNCLIDIEKYR